MPKFIEMTVFIFKQVMRFIVFEDFSISQIQNSIEKLLDFNKK